MSGYLVTNNKGGGAGGLTQEAADALYAPISHTHDDRYYTEAEITTLLTGKADSSHAHAAADITSGTLDNARVNWAAPAAIGSTTPAAGAFTNLTANATGVLFKNQLHGTAGINFADVNADGRTRIKQSTQSSGIVFWHQANIVEIESGTEFRINSSSAFAPNLALGGSSGSSGDVRLRVSRTGTGADQTLYITPQRYFADNGQPYVHFVMRTVAFYTRSASWATLTGSTKTLEMAETGEWTFSTAVDVQAALRCDSLRIDTTPTAETITPTHTITVSIDGTNYKIPLVAA